MIGMVTPLLLALVLGAGGPSAAGDWPAYQGGADHRGTAPALAVPLETAWHLDLKTSIYASPVIVGGTVFAAGENGEVVAVSSRGEVLWRTRLDGLVYASTPAVADGILYVGSVRGRRAKTGMVSALSVADGATVWSTAMPGDVFSSPLVAGSLLVVGCDDRKVHALNRRTGAMVWSFGTGDKVHDNAAALSGGILYIGSFDGSLYALKAETGERLWSFKTRKRLNTSPTVVDGQVVAGGEDGRIVGLAAADGTERWSFQTRGAVVGTPVVTAESVFASSSDGFLYALGRDGSLKWKFRAGPHVVASPVVAGPVVWTAAIDTLAVLDQALFALDTATGAVVWKFPLKGPMFASPAVADGLMVIAAKTGRLYGFRSRPAAP